MTLCHRCDGDRFVPADEQRPDLLKPCPVCRADTHAEWARGAYEPDYRPGSTTREEHTPDPEITHWLGELKNWLRTG